MRAKRMLTIQNNLFPVDFSPSCVAMAPHVKRAAVIFGASATLVHVLDLYSHNESNSTCSSSLTRDWGRVADNPPEFGHEPVPIPRGKHHATSKITSSSTGVPSGRLATPYTSRQGFLSFPKTSCSNSEAPSATFG